MMIVLVGASLGTAARADKLPQYQQGWWQQVAAAIAASEYDIRGGGDARLLAVNRAQELRADFSATGASVTPRSAQDPGWSLGISLLGVEQYGALVPAAAGERTAADRTVTYSRDDIVETWTNEENGILLDVALSGSALLGNNSQLAFRLDTNLAAVVSDSASQIDFYADGVRVARLGLRASTPGAGGKPTAQLEGNRLLILAPKTPGIVNKVSMALTTAAGEDTGVGPSTTADSILNEEQPDSNFALSVAAAGDVNGDGYSDVVVGAPDYDVGQLAAAGRVLIYLGSASGLATSPIWTRDGDVAGGRFGSSVASAGDFNADGISDVVVGADTSNLAVVFAGSGSADLTEVARFSGEAGSGFGFSVDSAGDINGDGADDIVVGSPEYNAGDGRAYVYFSPFGTAPTAGTSYCLAVPDVRLGCMAFPPPEPTCPGSQFGYSVSGAGDVDGDGKDDLIVGAPSYDRSPSFCATPGSGQREGEAFVYLGSDLDVIQNPGECSAVADWCTEEGKDGDQVGYSVDTAGDVDGDGLDDIIVGAPSYTHAPQEVDCGSSAANVGAAIVFRATGDPEILQKTIGSTFKSKWIGRGAGNSGDPIPETRFGAFVASAGDVNGDGVGDVIVGAPDDASLALAGGAAFLYTGSIDVGLKTTYADPAVVFGNGSCYLTGVALSTDADWSVRGIQGGGNLGRVVAGAGDVDSDGFSDLLVGERGSASAFTGAGFPPRGDLSGSGVPVSENVAAFVGDVNGDGRDDEVWVDNNRFVLRAGRSDGHFDHFQDNQTWVLMSNIAADDSIAGAGDVNGDGYADIVVGLPSTGQVRVFAGGNPPNTSASWIISAAAGPFGTEVSSAGDVNGDGYSDIIVGDAGLNSDTGRVAVFLGGSTRLPASGQLNTDAAAADWSAVGAGPGARFGASVAGAGDVNADGYGDVIVGAPGDGVSDTGAAFLYLGSLQTPLAAQTWTAIGPAQAGARFGESVASAGDLNGDGFGDVVVGAPGTDLFGLPDVGRAYAYLGSAAGLSVIETWSADGVSEDNQFGRAVGDAGDINGDGLSDLVAGTSVFLGARHGVSSVPAWTTDSVELNSGIVFAGASMSGGGDYNGDGFGDFYIDGVGPFLGNTYFGRDKESYQATGVTRLPMQLQAGRDVTIAPQGILDQDTGTSFRIRVERPPAPGRYGLEWEIKPLGTPFDGSGLQRGDMVEFPPGSTDLKLTETIDTLEPGTPYRWRARIVNDSVTVPHSAWLSISGGTQGAHLLTAGARAPFPFASIGPAQDLKVFADTLPLLFQWHAGSASSFELEWAGNADFSDPRVSSGSLSATGNDIETYMPDPAAWVDILRTARNPDFRDAPVFWRIIADGGTSSETRALRLAAAEAPLVSAPVDGQTSFAPPLFAWDPNHNERFQIRFSATAFLGEPRVIVADGDDSPDGPDDYDITGTGITIPDAIWSQVEALVPPGADGTGVVYFAVRGRDVLGRTTISDVRSLRVNATGTPPQPPKKKKGGGSTSPSSLLLLAILVLVTCGRRRSCAPGRIRARL